jgi:hypothetical protein
MNNPQPWWLTWPVAEVAATILPLFPVLPVGHECEGLHRQLVQDGLV